MWQPADGETLQAILHDTIFRDTEARDCSHRHCTGLNLAAHPLLIVEQMKALERKLARSLAEGWCCAFHACESG